MLVGLLLLLIFSPDAKAWFLKQLLTAGLFKGEVRTGNKNEHLPVANSFSFRNEKGNVVFSTELKGKVVFINFWATWCPPCRAEMPFLNVLYNKLKDDGRFVFIFLNEDDKVDKAKEFLNDNNYSFPIATAVGGIPDEIFSGTLPTTVVLNKEGKIVMKHEGLANYNSAQFIRELKSLL